MKIEFRHGIISHKQTSGIQEFLRRSQTSPNHIDLVATVEDEFIYTISHGKANYVFTYSETRAGTFVSAVTGEPVWLYVDHDPSTAKPSFHFTKHEPIVSTDKPANPRIDQHWFDLTERVQKVWLGSSWVPRVRLVFAKFDGINAFESLSTTPSSYTGSTIGDTRPVDAGSIFYDSNGDAIQSKDGTFFTTTTNFFTGTSNVTTFNVESHVDHFTTSEKVLPYRIVTVTEDRTVRNAEYNDIGQHLIGVAVTGGNTGESITVSFGGIVENEEWRTLFQGSIGRKLYVTSNGVLSVSDPFSITSPAFSQRQPAVGKIVNETSMLFQQDISSSSFYSQGNDGLSNVLKYMEDNFRQASAQKAGIVYLSVEPEHPDSAIAVGTNDPRMTDARIPLEHFHSLSDVLTSDIEGLQSRNLRDAMIEIVDRIDSKVSKLGDTMQGQLFLTQSPTDPDHAASKHYVDSVAMGLNWKDPVMYMSLISLEQVIPPFPYRDPNPNHVLGPSSAITDGSDTVTVEVAQGEIVETQSDKASNNIRQYTVAVAGRLTYKPNCDEITGTAGLNENNILGPYNADVYVIPDDISIPQFYTDATGQVQDNPWYNYQDQGEQYLQGHIVQYDEESKSWIDRGVFDELPDSIADVAIQSAFIVAGDTVSAPTGSLADRKNQIYRLSEGEWDFLQPEEKCAVYVLGENEYRPYNQYVYDEYNVYDADGNVIDVIGRWIQIGGAAGEVVAGDYLYYRGNQLNVDSSAFVTTDCTEQKICANKEFLSNWPGDNTIYTLMYNGSEVATISDLVAGRWTLIDAATNDLYRTSSGEKISVDTNDGSFRVFLPENPLEGTSIEVIAQDNTSLINNPLIIDGNQRKIIGQDADYSVDSNDHYLFIYSEDPTIGWQVYKQDTYVGDRAKDKFDVETWIYTNTSTQVNVGERRLLETLLSPITLTLPQNPQSGETIYFRTVDGDFETVNQEVILDPGAGYRIMNGQLGENLCIDVNNVGFSLTYVDNQQQGSNVVPKWLLYNLALRGNMDDPSVTYGGGGSFSGAPTQTANESGLSSVTLITAQSGDTQYQSPGNQIIYVDTCNGPTTDLTITLPPNPDDETVVLIQPLTNCFEPTTYDVGHPVTVDGGTKEFATGTVDSQGSVSTGDTKLLLNKNGFITRLVYQAYLNTWTVNFEGMLAGNVANSLGGISQDSIQDPDSGYVRFSNSLVYQWGVITSTTLDATYHTVTFPYQFKGACFSVQATIHMTSTVSAGAIAPVVTDMSLTGCRIAGDPSGSSGTQGDIHWFAIGR